MIQKKELEIESSIYAKHATLYTETNVKARACILYFHGGGLLYGSRRDLPQLHLKTLTQAGCAVIAYDYPLAPAAGLEVITEDVAASVNDYVKNGSRYLGADLPFFLWGRSAGAYLVLLAAASGQLAARPNGILSYYGYGFLCDNWFSTPSPYYSRLPRIDDSCLKAVPSSIHAGGNLDTHYSVYVYARQTGKWADLIYTGRAKYFYLNYSLRACTSMPCPLFCAHSTGDTDVPYSEFLELCQRYSPKRFIAPCDTHDFDRMESDPLTAQLLNATVDFLEAHL